MIVNAQLVQLPGQQLKLWLHYVLKKRSRAVCASQFAQPKIYGKEREMKICTNICLYKKFALSYTSSTEQINLRKRLGFLMGNYMWKRIEHIMQS